MDAIAVKAADTEHQLDLDFRLHIVPGNIKKAMAYGNQDVVEPGEEWVKFGSSDLWNIDPRCISVIPGYNIRVKNKKYHEEIQKLKNNMLEVGFKRDSPISVLVVDLGDGKQGYVVKRGHRRLEAVMLAIAEGGDFKTIPSVIVKDDSSEEDLTVDLVLSNNASPLAPYEVAVACKRMTRFHPDDHAKIAAKLCLWPTQVTDYLLLINGPMEIANYVRDDVVTFTLAIEVLKEHGAKALAVIEQSLARARGAGKKLTRRFVPGKVLEKAVIKAAPEMKQAIVEIKQDQAFNQLSPETRQKLETILQAFKEAEEAEAKLDAENPSPEPGLNLDQVED